VPVAPKKRGKKQQVHTYEGALLVFVQFFVFSVCKDTEKGKQKTEMCNRMNKNVCININV